MKKKNYQVYLFNFKQFLMKNFKLKKTRKRVKERKK